MRINIRSLCLLCHYSNAVNWMVATYTDTPWESYGWDPQDESAPAFIRKALGIRFV